MLEEKITLVRPTRRELTKRIPFGIHEDIYNLLRGLSKESGVPMITIMRQCVIFGLKHVEFIEEEDDLDDMSNVKWGKHD